MYRTLSTSALAVATLVALSGCQEGTLFGDNRANIAGPASVLETGVIEPIQVQELVNTINMAAIVKPSVPPTAQVTFDDAVVNYEQQQKGTPTNNGAWANLRNALQDRILLASQSRCAPT